MIIERKKDADGKEGVNFKITKSDLNAIAYSEYFRKQGIKWVMGIIIIALLTQLARILLPVIPLIVVYGLLVLAFAWIMIIYTKGQNRHKRKLWKDLEDAGVMVHSEED